MPTAPRLTDDIRQNMLARIQATSPLTDLDEEGGVVASILGAFAEDVAFGEARIFELWTAKMFQARGEDLDLFVAGIPIEPRRGATPSTGGTFTLYRSPGTAEVTVPAGALVAVDPDNPEHRYTNLTSIHCPAATPTVSDNDGDDITWGSISLGETTEAPAGSVRQLVTGYSDIYAVVNATRVAGGTDQESDELLQHRAFTWVQKVQGGTEAAVRAEALEFVDSTGKYATSVVVVTYPEMPGYTEVIPDDGEGFAGYTRPAEMRSGVIPDVLPELGRYTMWFDAPAATTPKLVIERSGDPSVTYYNLPGNVLLKHEQGVAVTLQNVSPPTAASILPDDTWRLYGHRVFAGYPAELQARLRLYQERTGLRIRVVLPTLQNVVISGYIQVSPGFNSAAVIAATKAVMVEYKRKYLKPGQPLLFSELYDYIGSAARGPVAVRGLTDIVFDTNSGRIIPLSARHRINYSAGSITLRTNAT